MALTYGKKEDDYRKRLLIILPISSLLVGLLFITSDVVPYSELEKRVGWEGETQLLPEVTIVPDRDIFEDMSERSQMRTMSSIDVSLLEERGPEEGGLHQPEEQAEEDIVIPEILESEIRHFPAHTDVPYSEDFVILFMVQPDYPPQELLAGIEGDVTIEILVNESGLVENAWVLASLGPRSFEAASLDAVKQFRFKPPMEHGTPIQMWIRFQIRFRLFG